MRKARWFCPLMMTLAAISLATHDVVAQELRVGDRIRIKTISDEAGQLIGTYYRSCVDHVRGGPTQPPAERAR